MKIQGISDIIPDPNGVADLGDSSNRFGDVYMDQAKKISMGRTDQSNTVDITHVNDTNDKGVKISINSTDVLSVNYNSTSIVYDTKVSSNLTLDDYNLVMNYGGNIQSYDGFNTREAISIDSSGEITKLGQDTPSSGEFLKWDGASSKVVWDTPSGGSGSGVSYGFPSGYDSTAAPNATNGYKILENNTVYNSSSAENTNMDGTNNVKYLIKFNDPFEKIELKLTSVLGEGDNLPDVIISLSTFSGNSIFSGQDTDPEGFTYIPATGAYEVLDGSSVSSSGTTTATDYNSIGYFIFTVGPQSSGYTGSYTVTTKILNTKPLRIYEDTGTLLSSDNGTIVLQHGDTGGESSILFKSATESSDYGFIKYDDTGASNGTTDNSLLEIGVRNDDATNNVDELKLSTFGGYIYMTGGGNVGIGKTNPSVALDVSGSILYSGTISQSSDDRLKENEILLTNATTTLEKLKPQLYDKKPSFTATDTSTWKSEGGLIAQEIYYQAPELRHIVTVGEGGTPAENINIPDDPSIDPDYSSWGSNPASVDYTGLIPYLIKSIQELKTTIDSQHTVINSQQTTINDLNTRVQVLEGN